MNHFILKCPEGHVIAQCKCPGPKVSRVGAKQDCPECVAVAGLPSTIETTIYLHRDKESNSDLMDEHNLPDSLRDSMLYIGYEIAIKIEIDSKTGKTFATHFAGTELPTKVKLN